MSVLCELCYANIVRGIVHETEYGYICDDCAQMIRESDSVWFDEDATKNIGERRRGYCEHV